MTEEDKGYAAGFLDGEGCFTYPGNKCLVVAENTNRPVVEWLHLQFGGSFSILANKKKPNWRPTYRWAVAGKDAIAVCQILAPYLKEKQRQALLILSLGQTMVGRGNKVPADVQEERDRLALLIKEEKHALWSIS